jgi:exopolyphosphatase/guanosine-5'-triphosphate,3'-diphosphate pyrophosphatase
MAEATEVIGVRLEILSGDEEGTLSFAGATANLPAELIGAGPVLVADIGGGSTELAVGRPMAGTRSAGAQTRSLDIGCVRVTERFLQHDPPFPDEVAAARVVVEDELRVAQRTLPDLVPDSLLIGLAGTVSTLTCLVHEVAEYDRSRIHHSVLERADVEAWLDILAGEDVHARLSHLGMDEGREDVIVGGTIVLAAIMSVFERDRCLVSEDDILDGLAASLLAEPPVM